jgi:hypothetical protein
MATIFLLLLTAKELAAARKTTRRPGLISFSFLSSQHAMGNSGWRCGGKQMFMMAKPLFCLDQ